MEFSPDRFNGLKKELKKTRAPQELFSPEATPYYHCVFPCVRCDFLCGEDEHSVHNFDHRKTWTQVRLVQLTGLFAIDISTYAVMVSLCS